MKQISRRPFIRLTFRKSEIFLELFGAVLIISYWVVIHQVYSNLPDLVPSRFSAQGEVLGWSSKDILFTLPKVATILYLLMTVFSFIPNVYNMTVITEENAEYEYRKAVRTIRALKIIVLLVFFVISIVLYVI